MFAFLAFFEDWEYVTFLQPWLFSLLTKVKIPEIQPNRPPVAYYIYRFFCPITTYVLFLGDNIGESLRKELYKTVFQYWLEWIFVSLSVIIWLLITFLLPVPNCPTGYLGPGGKHHHGQYENCTGGNIS